MNLLFYVMLLIILYLPVLIFKIKSFNIKIDMNISNALQKFIPFAYLYLVVMGILKETVFYYFLNINILKYSSIMDILISPISDITSNPRIIFAVFLMILIGYVVIKILSKYRSKSWAKKFLGLKESEELSDDEMQIKLGSVLVAISATALLSFFLGTGFSGGKKLAENIENKNLKFEHKLTLNSGESTVIHLINVNSVNYFYIEQNSSNIKISPVGAIKSLELFKK